ncbi:hypothetical protein [Streptomyces sp. 35G-GA-8]|uniref:hypothetical protein n=1 Tax=Streptomyces sp. 35G-GA-8 TaxID=2939434 RepID=UPI00201F819E|nr:hypothetical protein [Streptomyces sp. 35G-GA-8]MCL7376986.1 hypothetical protein [Streptomyces sp. 35G-GA-8]
MTDLSLFEPVAALLAQTGAPHDVPDSPGILCGNWLTPMTAQALALLSDTDPAHAGGSFTGNGHTHLLIAPSTDTRSAVYLRLHASGDVSPEAAADKTVVLGLAGTSDLEAFRHEGDVADDHPWYVREFGPESIYACHADTIVALRSSHDSCQLVITQDSLTPTGRTLSADEYLRAVKSAHRLLTNALNTVVPAHPLTGTGDQK